MYTCIEILKGFYAIQEDIVRSYLICGSDRALLLDTGNGSGMRELVSGLYPGEIVVAHTHAHSDHIACDREFSAIHAHRAEWSALLASGVPEDRLHELNEGSVFDLGGRRLEAWHTPGHTKGGMTFLDWENRLIFSGDLVSDRPIYMFMDGADLREYKMSLEWLISLEPYFDALYGCHGTLQQSFDQARRLSALKDLLLHGEATEQRVVLNSGVEVLQMSAGGAAMYLPLTERERA